MNLTKNNWSKIYRQNIGKMIGVCYRYIPNNQIAEDLAHDAFIIAIEKSATYKGEGCIEAWLRRIVVNTALQHLRKQSANRVLVELELYENKIMAKLDDENDLGIIENADFTKEELLNAVANLPEHHKIVFNMYVIDGYSHVQIGEELGISSGTSKSHLARARKKLQQVLNEKALEKQRKKDWKRAFIILIFPCKSKGIDQLYQIHFNNFILQPRNPLKINNLNLGQHTTPLIKTNLLSTKSLLITMLIFTTAYFVYMGIRKKQIDQSLAKKFISDTINQHMQTTASIFAIDQPDTRLVRITNIDTIDKIAPVVIKKKHIKHNPVIVKRALIVKDTTNDN